MEKKPYHYAIIGGDRRQTFLAENLAKAGKHVCHFALEAAATHPLLHETFTLEEAITQSDVIIGPIPFSKDQITLHHAYKDASLSLGIIEKYLQPTQYLFAGCIPHVFSESCLKKGVKVYDLMNDEKLAIYNSIATAEGAICEAISRSTINLHHSKCAVLGYGKCGRTLAAYLKGLFANVDVYTDNPIKFSEAEIVANTVLTLSAFSAEAESYDFIFNTIPAVVLTPSLLSVLSPNVTIIDIASAPGGVDYKEAKKQKLSATLCPSLPGKYAPGASASAIERTISSILSNQ